MGLRTVVCFGVILIMRLTAAANGQNPAELINSFMTQTFRNTFIQPNSFGSPNMFSSGPQTPGFVPGTSLTNFPGSTFPNHQRDPSFPGLQQGPFSDPQQDPSFPGPQQGPTFPGPGQGSTFNGPRHQFSLNDPRQTSFNGPSQGLNFNRPRQGPSFTGPQQTRPGYTSMPGNPQGSSNNAENLPVPSVISGNPEGSSTSSGNPQGSSTSGGNPQGFSTSGGNPQGSSTSGGNPQGSSTNSTGSQLINSVPTSPHHSSQRRHPNFRRSRPHSLFKPSGDPLKGFRIVCLFNNRHYYRGGFTPSLLDPSLCTHLNYEFAILDPKTHEMITGEPDLDVEQNFYQEAIDLKKVNPKLKVLLSLGGWSDSTKKYSELAADKELRKKFITKAIEFLKSHEFDGLDFAWEYPNCWQGAIGVSPKDKDNYVTLLKEMKTEFTPNNLLLTASVGALKREVEAAYDVPGIAAAVDYLNVMTYDMHGPWEPVTGHHVQFEALPGDTDPYCNVKGGMQVWIEKGADKKKLNMGLALYGKTFTLKDPGHCELGASAKGIGNPGPDSNEGGFLLYNEICQFLNSGNWTEKEDKVAGFYACSGDQFACYDPPMMMVRKAKYVVESGLGGVLLKDLSGDDYKGLCFSMPFPLLKMIRLEMIQKIAKLHL